MKNTSALAEVFLRNAGKNAEKSLPPGGGGGIMGTEEAIQ